MSGVLRGKRLSPLVIRAIKWFDKSRETFGLIGAAQGQLFLSKALGCVEEGTVAQADASYQFLS